MAEGTRRVANGTPWADAARPLLEAACAQARQGASRPLADELAKLEQASYSTWQTVGPAATWFADPSRPPREAGLAELLKHPQDSADSLAAWHECIALAAALGRYEATEIGDLLEEIRRGMVAAAGRNAIDEVNAPLAPPTAREQVAARAPASWPIAVAVTAGLVTLAAVVVGGRLHDEAVQEANEVIERLAAEDL
jgi:type VI protein secretion system component VasF